MHDEMSQKTKQEVMVQLRRQYAKSGPDYKSRLIDQAIELLGCHRKAATGSLNWKATLVRSLVPSLGRPREY